MKKLIIAVLVAVAITGSAFAAPETVSLKVTTQFKADFAYAENVTWKVDKDFVKASFILDEEKIEAFYTNNGELIATSKAIAFNKLPKKALRVIGERYPFPPYELKEAIQVTTPDSGTDYYVSFSTAKETLIVKVDVSGSISEFKHIAK